MGTKWELRVQATGGSAPGTTRPVPDQTNSDDGEHNDQDENQRPLHHFGAFIFLQEIKQLLQHLFSPPLFLGIISSALILSAEFSQKYTICMPVKYFFYN